MPAFLENIELFRGTGEQNREGLELEAFLDAYDPDLYRNPSNTVDTLVFACPKQIVQVESGLKLLLIKRGDHPCIGHWALPGGFVNINESLDEAARRELEEETGIRDLPAEQIFTWGNPERDPRTRVITTAYLALARESELRIEAGDDADDAAWFDVAFAQNSRETDEQKNQERTCYRLTLESKKKRVTASAVVEVIEKQNGILKAPSYRVLDSDMLAADHGAIITQALLYLKARLSNMKGE